MKSKSLVSVVSLNNVRPPPLLILSSIKTLQTSSQSPSYWSLRLAVLSKGLMNIFLRTLVWSANRFL